MHDLMGRPGAEQSATTSASTFGSSSPAGRRATTRGYPNAPPATAYTLAHHEVAAPSAQQTYGAMGRVPRSGRMAREHDHRAGQPQAMMDMLPMGEQGLPTLSSPVAPHQDTNPNAPNNKRQRIAPPSAGDAELQDKADRCRARNREHARQTRRRKKEFVESLQVSVQQLDHENKIMAARLANLDERAQERERRADAVAAILALRVKDDDDPDAAKQWAELVEADFELKLPHTPYRSYAPYEATSTGRIVSGIPAVMADVKSLRVCLGALKRRFASKDAAHGAARKHSEAAVVAAAKEQQQQQQQHDMLDDDQRRSFDVDVASDNGGATSTQEVSSSSNTPNTMLRDDPQSSSSNSDTDLACDTECVLERSALAWSLEGSLMAPWTLRVSDTKRQVILQQRGMLRATFRGRSSTARGELVSHSSTDDERAFRKERVAVLELAFDTVSFWKQLQRGTRPDRIFKPVPNTLDQALQPSDEARVITSASRPFVIEYVNGAWTKLCGYDPDECVGKTLGIIQGSETNQDVVHKLTNDAVKGHATSAVLTNYNKDGQKFQNFVRVFPLVDDDGSTHISHMLGVLQNVAA